MSSRCSSLSRTSPSRALSPCVRSMHCVRPQAQTRVRGSTARGPTTYTAGRLRAGRAQSSLAPTQARANAPAPRIRRTCLARASEPTISRTSPRALRRLPSACSRIILAVPDGGTLLHALSIGRAHARKFLKLSGGFTRDARAEGSRLGMLQSRQPTLTRRVSLPPVCSALPRRVRDDGADDRPEAPELLAAMACALALALPVSAGVCLLSRPDAPDLLAARARSPAPCVCVPPRGFGPVCGRADVCWTCHLVLNQSNCTEI
jgi:hypothetical protein